MKRKVLTASVLAGLGLLAAGLLVALAIYLWSQPTRVEQLMEVLADGDPGDAAWAFEKLKEVPHRELEDFLSYLESTRPTPLEQMSASFEISGASRGFNGSISGPPRPFELSKVAQFFLSTRLTGDIEVREPGAELAPRWKAAFERSADPETLSLQERWFGRHIFPPPKVIPPSKVPDLARLARDCDIEGLLAVLRTNATPEVTWAVEVLKRAPDERLDLLLGHLGSAENVAVRSLFWNAGGMTCPHGRPLGGVARFLLWNRLGIRDSSLWAEDPPEASERVRSAWLARRGSNRKPGAAEVLSGLDEPYSEQVPEDE